MHPVTTLPAVAFLLHAMCLGPAAFAQQDPRSGLSLQDTIRMVPGVEQNTSAVFQLVDQYVGAGQFDRAVALMEDLYAEDPASLPVFTKLKQTYTVARRYDAVVRLMEDRIERYGPVVHLLAELGAALHQADRTGEALAAWSRAVETGPDAEMTYRIVANEMGKARLFDEAAEVLLRGRAHIGDSLLYRAELANIHGLAGNYGAAADEYLALLAQNGDSVERVRAQMRRFVAAEGAAEAYSASVDRAIRRDPLNRAYRELAAWLALERGDYSAALDANIAIDRLQGEQGQSLYGFASAAIAGGAFDEAQRALSIILERHPTGPIASHARFAHARLLERMAEEAGESAVDAEGARQEAPLFEAALGGYTDFARLYPHHPSAGEALARAAELQQTVFRDFAAAESLLRDLATRARDPGLANSARLDLGRVAVGRGDLGAARTTFTQVEEAIRIGPLAESARLELAWLDFYEADFDGALARVDAMNQNTASDAANDAIGLKLLLRENVGPDSLSQPLRAYASAALLHRQQRFAEALEALETLLSTAGAHPISDEAAFLRVRSLRDLQRPTEALSAIDAFEARYLDSYLVERAAFLRGEIFERDLGETATAMDAYARFLEKFPGSLLAPEARSRLRKLRGDRPPG